MSELAALLARLDGRPYPAYRDLARRAFAVGRHRLTIEHVQPDPFAAPSRVAVAVAPDAAALPGAARAAGDARRAAADAVHRALARRLREPACRGLAIAAPGPAVLERTAVTVDADGAVTLRLTAALPAAGRRILGDAAAALLADALPRAVDAALDDARAAAPAHVRAVEDQVALRAQLAARGLVAFLADGSVLPRRSGVDPRPLPDAVPLSAPPSLAVTLDAPHAGRVRGLGIPAGVTLLVGGGYHGKSTLLDAIARAVDDHPPGDGRERCATDAAAVTIRAEDGRSVRGVDLRPFVGRLPLGRDTARFDTDDASGSTSQAAAIVEALEAGARVLLVDEDTAAANLMQRDARMRRLVAAEPLTPLVDRARQLHRERCVSLVVVVGGAGDWLDVADTVIQLADYVPRDVGVAARAVAAALPLGDAAPRAPGPWPPAAPRVPAPASLDPSRGRRAAHVRAHRTHTIAFGEEEIDVSLVAQLDEDGRTRFVGDALLALARGVADGRRDVPGLLDALDALLDAGGVAAIAAPGFGDRTRVRRFEIAAALNRLRALRLVD